MLMCWESPLSSARYMFIPYSQSQMWCSLNRSDFLYECICPDALRTMQHTHTSAYFDLRWGDRRSMSGFCLNSQYFVTSHLTTCFIWDSQEHVFGKHMGNTSEPAPERCVFEDFNKDIFLEVQNETCR